jgi:putative endonuclease
MKLFTGKKGEDIAECYLQKKGFKTLFRNFKTALGEIDLISLYQGTVVFVEVKTNSSTEFGTPEARVNYRKQRQIIKVAQEFLKMQGKTDTDCRFDVISVLLNADHAPSIEHFENAFELQDNNAY